jgi:RNA polymerase sigma-70 factor (ECF subfamily)
LCPHREPSSVDHDSLIVSNTPPADSRADELLAIRCQLGERTAFDELIARWHEPLWRYLRRLADREDVVADLVQDTWIRVLRGIARLREPASLRPWLFGIARRVAMDRLRLRYSRPPQDDADLDQIAAPLDDLDPDADIAALDSAMAALPLADREALTLFYLRELTIPEMARLLQIPEGTIKSRLFRARQALRRELDNTGVLR